MKNEFEEHGNALTTAVGGLITAGGALLIGALGALAKSRKEKVDEKEEVILETNKYKVSKKK